jgi:hypothetical protein
VNRAKAGLALGAASLAAFLLSAAMIKTPSPLLLVSVPVHFALGLACLLVTETAAGLRLASAASLLATFVFLFYQTFLGG